MEQTEVWPSLVYVIILHPRRRQILVCQEEARWVLPQTQIAPKWVTPTHTINAEMQRLYGLQTTLLRQIDHREDASVQRVYVTHLLEMIDILHERDATVQSQLRHSYLSMWLAHEPMERLLEMWQIAYPLCALHQAVSYRYIILANERADCKDQMAWAMPFWFGKILESLNGANDE